MHLWNKWYTLICSQRLRKAKPMNNIPCDKINYLLMCHILERNNLFPLSKIMCSHPHKTFSFWWRSYLPNKIKSTWLKPSWLNNRMNQSNGWLLNIIKSLKLFTPFVVVKTTGSHTRPIIKSPFQQSLHLESWWMHTINSSLNVSHSNLSLI